MKKKELRRQLESVLATVGFVHVVLAPAAFVHAALVHTASASPALDNTGSDPPSLHHIASAPPSLDHTASAPPSLTPAALNPAALSPDDAATIDVKIDVNSKRFRCRCTKGMCLRYVLGIGIFLVFLEEVTYAYSFLFVHTLLRNPRFRFSPGQYLWGARVFCVNCVSYKSSHELIYIQSYTTDKVKFKER